MNNNPIPPTTTMSTGNGIRINGDYLKSIPGIIRILLILFQFAGWVSAASIFKINVIGYSLRDAYLTFSIIGFLLSIVIFVFIFVALVERFNNIPWTLIIFVTDLVWIVPMFILAIVCAVDESKFGKSVFFNEGALASAAFFGFCSTLLYLADAIIYGLKIKNNNINIPPV